MNHLIARKSPVGSHPLLTEAWGSQWVAACALVLVFGLALPPAICQGQAAPPPVHQPRNATAQKDLASAAKDRKIATVSEKGYDRADACAQLRCQCIYAIERQSPLVAIMCRSPLTDVTDDEGRTPLMVAVDRSDTALTAFFLERTDNVNAKDHRGDTAIIHAAGLNFSQWIKTELINMLLQRGAEMSLFVAAALGDEREAGRLIQGGADVNARTGTDLTPLLIAVRSRHPGMVRFLLDNGADVNAEDSTGASPLCAAWGREGETVKRLLLARGAKMTLPLAAALCDLPEVHRLIDSGTDVNLKGLRGHTALHMATECGSAELVTYLINQGADVNVRDRNGFTLLIHAVMSGELDLVMLLTERGADVNARTKNGLTPLAAVGCADRWVKEATLLEIAKYLMSKGAKINFYSHESGLSPLMEAAQNKRPKLVKLLIERGADVNARTWCPKTTRLLAVLDCPFGPESAKHDHTKQDRSPSGSVWAWASDPSKIRQWLLCGGSGASADFNEGVTALMVAATSGDMESVRLLIEAGADVNAKTTYDKQTALHQGSTYEVMKILIQHGADVNAQTSVGGTPLMRACKSPGDIHRCTLLVEHGANVNLRSRDGHTALDLAYGTLAQSDRVVEYLKSKGAVSGLKNLQQRDDVSRAN